MDLIGELVTVRGRLNELAAARRDPAADDVAIQISRLSADLQAGIIQARMTPVWQGVVRVPAPGRELAPPPGQPGWVPPGGKGVRRATARLGALGDPPPALP